MTNVPISDPHISYSQQFHAPILFSNTCPQRDHLFGFCCYRAVALEVSLINTFSRETILKRYIEMARIRMTSF